MEKAPSVSLKIGAAIVAAVFTYFAYYLAFKKDKLFWGFIVFAFFAVSPLLYVFA